MKNFEVIIVLNRLSDEVRSIKRSLVYTYINKGYIIDKDNKQWHNITIRDWW